MALGTIYEKGYYDVELTTGNTFYVKNVDTKADEHTDVNNCYTTADDSIVEVSTFGTTDYSYLGNSSVKEVYVSGIYRKE